VTRVPLRAAAVVLTLLAGGLALPTPAAQAATASPVRILLEGDSITQGNDGDFTWRYRFYKELVRQHVRFDFVGSRTSPYVEAGHRYSTYADPSFDRQHFAQGGSTIAWHVARIRDEVASQKPDVVVFAAGINDLRARHTVADTDYWLRRWVTQVRAAKPNIKILISPVLDATDARSPWLPQRIREFRAQETATAQALSTSTSPIRVADTDRGWSVAADTYDNLHPTPTGETLIAQRIAEAFYQLRWLPIPHTPSIYRYTAWTRVALAGVRTSGRQIVLTWDSQALSGIRILLRRSGHKARISKLQRGSQATTSPLRPGRYVVRIQMIRSRISTPFGPRVKVRVRRGAARY
jgi:hypothetical protein